MIQQTLFSCLYLTDHTLYADCPVLKAFIEALLYVVNTFYRQAQSTQVLRDEDITFPPTTEYFSNKTHPILKNLTFQGVQAALEAQAGTEFAPYLTWMSALVLTTGWTMEPKEVDFMKVT